MRHFLKHVYAAQRLMSFRKIQQRQHDETLRGVGWLTFYVIVLGTLLLAAVLKGGAHT